MKCWRCDYVDLDPFTITLDDGVTVRAFICPECGAVNREDSADGAHKEVP